jgi:predicted ATP-grasp superfamily ATP-dependent carboligase
MGCNPYDFGSLSRYAEFVFCENLNDEEKVMSTLSQISKNAEKRMVLFCTSDLHVLFISKNREILKKHYDFILPDHNIIETLMDKKNLNGFASKHGFPVPKTFFSQNESDIHEIAKTIHYPCVVKPLYRTAYWSQNIPPEKKVFKADSPVDLIQQIKELDISNQSLILQEWIPGGDQQVHFCLAYFNEEGQPLALFNGRKLRQYPPLTGVTSIAESIQNKVLSSMAVDFLKTGGCKGLCSVEFKYDNRDNSFKITEPTVGRVDLQEGISTQAGLDIPFIAYQDAIKKAQYFQSDYRIGLKWINEPFELNAFLTQRRINGYSAGQFFHPYHGQRSFAVMAWDDPKPFLFFLKRAYERGGRYFKRVFSKNVRQDA